MKVLIKLFKFLIFLKKLLDLRRSKVFNKYFFDIISQVSDMRKFDSHFTKNFKPKLEKNFIYKDFPIENDYLISTDKGIFYIRKNLCYQLYDLPVHGLCYHEKKIYFTTSAGKYSMLIKANFNSKVLANNIGLTSMKLLLQIETAYGNERIHGICFDYKRKKVCVANTKRNSILFVDHETGEIDNEVFLMKDLGGYFISRDHNHINNVYENGGLIFFTMHNGGMGYDKEGGSLLGYTDLKKAYFYEYKRRGVHDILYNDEHLIFCDSFGEYHEKDSKINISGNLIVNGIRTKKCFFSELENNYLIRGFSWLKNEIVVGCSSISMKRSQRNILPGGLILLKKKNFFLEFNFSQVNEIINLRDKDNRKKIRICDIDKNFRKFVGEKILEIDLENKIVVEKLKI